MHHGLDSMAEQTCCQDLLTNILEIVLWQPILQNLLHLRRMAEDGFASLGISFEDPASMKASILAQFEGWAPQITDLVRACNGVPRIWPVYALPIGLRWATPRPASIW